MELEVYFRAMLIRNRLAAHIWKRRGGEAPGSFEPGALIT